MHNVAQHARLGLVFSVPKDLERLVAEIDGWLDLRCPDKALDRLQPLLDRTDARPEGLALRIRAYVATKQNKEAIIDLNELRTTSYQPEWLDLTEAWCRKRVQDLPGAIRCMLQLLHRTPKSAIGHYNLGCYLALSGEAQRALDEVTIACGLDPSFRELLWEEVDLDCLHKDLRFVALAENTSPTKQISDEGDDDDDDFADDGNKPPSN